MKKRNCGMGLGLYSLIVKCLPSVNENPGYTPNTQNN